MNENGSTAAPKPPDNAAENRSELTASATKVAAALAALQPDERDLILEAFLGTKYREIALRRGISEQAVKSTIRRGLRRIATIVRKVATQ